MAQNKYLQVINTLSKRRAFLIDVTKADTNAAT